MRLKYLLRNLEKFKMVKEEIFNLYSLNSKESVILKTNSQRLFEKILQDYPGEIFPNQIYSEAGLSGKNYYFDRLSIDLLRKIIDDSDENYEILSIGKDSEILIGQNENERWFSA